MDQGDNIYVFDGQTIRKINQNRDVTTIAGQPYVDTDADGVGTGATFATVSSMCTDNSGNVFLAAGSSIRRMSLATNVVTVAGSFSQSGYANGAGNVALFSGARGVCISRGMLFVADTVGRTYQIQTSPDLMNWVAHGNILLPSTPYLWFDANPVAGSRFYRALLLP